MKTKYITPELTRVGSVEDDTHFSDEKRLWLWKFLQELKKKHDAFDKFS